MKIFLDTANIEEIKKYSFIIDGVTTNPSLIARESRSFDEIVQEIISIVDGPISLEVISLHSDAMVLEAVTLSTLSQNVVIKIPMTLEGLKAVKILNTKNIKTNVTLVFSVSQAILAAKAGATYVSPFIGRLDDIGHDGMQVVRDTVTIFKAYNLKTEIVVASVRHPQHVIEAGKVGAHVVTIPSNVIEKMFSHPLTDIGLTKFMNDWKKVCEK